MSAGRVVSNRTWGVVAFGILVPALCMVLIRTGVGGSDSGQAFMASLPSLLTAAVAAGVALWAATRFESGEPLRRQWLLIGLGMGALFAGDAIFAYLEVFAGQDVPFPSIADVFYLASFPLLGVALLLALLGFRRSLNLRTPLILAGAATAVATVALWASVFQPIITDAEASTLEKVLGLFYPVGDFWLLIFPALALAMALSRLGGGRLAWPWWAVVVGFALISVADTLFAVLESQGTYASGSFVDLGWWVGYAAIAVGASLVVDVQRPRKRGGRS